MKNTLSRSLRFALSCALALLVFAGSSQAQTSTFTYQGNLTIGGTLANGGYDLQFKLYDQLTGGALQGSPNTVTVSGVTVTAGVFTAELDFGAGAFPGAARFLEISVRPAGSGGFTTLSPRQQLSSTPYAIRSLSAASADAATNATSAATATTATNFTGLLSGDVTGTQSATVVSTVGGLSAGNVAGGATLANNATDASTPSAIVRRDASGSFAAGTITASAFSGGAAGLTSLNAGNISSGTLADARLSANVATLDGDQTFTGGKTFSSVNGLLATGTFNSGTIPATGAGQRMMWYPRKIAFRAGSVSSSEWDDANIGLLSVAMGNSTRASGNASFAMGNQSIASGTASVALGSSATASGLSSIALGSSTTASGARTTALGYFASTNGNDGSFVYGDNSTTTLLNATAANQFNVRASGGLRLFASSDTSDETKPGLFISGTTGDTQINGNLTVSGTLSANVAGTATSATNFTGSLAGDVTGTQSATEVSTVGGVSAASVASGATLANNATNANTASAIVRRDASGNFTAGTITASAFSGGGGGLTSLNAGNISSGVLAIARGGTGSSTQNFVDLSSNQTGIGGNKTFTGTVTASSFSGGGSSLTALNASNISSGILNDARLSSNVALKSAANTFTADQTINANLTQDGTLVQFTLTDGFVAKGTFNDGSIPATGGGVRMMWYPNKAAFRAGRVSGTRWDDANIGDHSVALGQDVTASGLNSVVLGQDATASGNNSVALGDNTTASGDYSFAAGANTTASGIRSTALGNNASTGGYSGAFVYGDNNAQSTVTATAANQFNVRASGGLRFFAANDTSDTTKAGLFISGTTGNTQLNGSLTVSDNTQINGSLTVSDNTQINGDLTVSGTISGSSITNLNASNISSGTLNDARLSSNVALLSEANTFTASQTINASLIQSGTLVRFTPTNGFVVGGTFGSGSIPATDSGARMMWYPGKAAFRAGYVSGSQWNSPGDYSTAFGYNATANGEGAFAAGYEPDASGQFAVAIGYNTEASGQAATALGYLSEASERFSTAIGNRATASGQASVAMGILTTASGDYTTALGSNASTNGKGGSFIYGDSSTFSTISATVNNQFVVRAQNMWFGTTNSVTNTSGRFLETSTGAYLTTGGTWTNSSSRALKTDFAPVNARATLQKVLQLPIQTWSYKAEAASVRHIGAISQDFNRLFGFGDSAETISTVDADGVAMAAIQGLHEELKDRDARIERLDQQAKEQQLRAGQLEQQVKQQQAVIDGLRQLLCAKNPQAAVCRPETRK